MATQQQQSDWQFPYFADLPTELREMIWQACLPHRIQELDEPEDRTYWDAKEEKEGHYHFPCNYWKTSIQNVKPPTITRVCRESRRVALQAGHLHDWEIESRFPAFHRPPPFEWIDHKRSSPHISYIIVQEEWDWCLDTPFTEDSIGRLATAVSSKTSPGSFYIELLSGRRSPEWAWLHGRPNADDLPLTGSPRPIPLSLDDRLPVTGPINFEPTDYTFIENKEKYTAMKRHAVWLVIMDTIVLHCVSEAIATGLFGVYGDAPIQVISIAEEHKIDQLLDLLAATDQCGSVVCVQRYERDTSQNMKSKLRSLIWAQQYPDELVDRLQPAIMFRLCRERCNKKTSIYRQPTAVEREWWGIPDDFEGDYRRFLPDS